MTRYLAPALLLSLAVLSTACGKRNRGAKHPSGATAQAAPEPDTAPKCQVRGPAYAIPAPGPLASAAPVTPTTQGAQPTAPTSRGAQ